MVDYGAHEPLVLLLSAKYVPFVLASAMYRSLASVDSTIDMHEDLAFGRRLKDIILLLLVLLFYKFAILFFKYSVSPPSVMSFSSSLVALTDT